MREPKDELLPTRASLLMRLQDWQNTVSWQEFFDTYWRLIYGVARKSDLSDSEAQDVVQDVLIHVAKQMPTFKYDPSIGSFKGWLLTKARWCIITQVRQRTRSAFAGTLSSDADESASALPDPAASLDEIWEEEWQQNLMEAAYQRIKRRIDGQKLQVFEFYVRKEFSAEDVAAKFNIPVEQVYLIKHRVTEALKQEVSRLEREVT
jgi:RNA polymerase sigma factor (sigma-70 family)